MGTVTQRSSATVSKNWTDITLSIPGAANAAGVLRNQSGQMLDVIKGGLAPVAGESGIAVPAYGQEYCEADHIWVRSLGRVDAVVAFEVIS